METKHFYEPGLGHGLAHDPFNSIVAPRPIGWISTHDGEGRHNLAPYSFFNAFGYVPPIVGFASLGRKDTVRNCQRTGEFAWNLVTMELAQAMNATSATVAPEVDEFGLGRLTAVPGVKIAAPRVAESPVNFECRVTQILRLRDAAGRETQSWMVFGEVVAVHIAQRLIHEGVYRTAEAHPVARGGGPADYFEIRPEALFRMTRPQ